MDHERAVSQGGQTLQSNLAIMHPACNQLKGSRASFTSPLNLYLAMRLNNVTANTAEFKALDSLYGMPQPINSAASAQHEVSTGAQAMQHERIIGTAAAQHVGDTGAQAMQHERIIGTAAAQHEGDNGAQAMQHERIIGTAAAQHEGDTGAQAMQHERIIGTAAAQHERIIGTAAAQHEGNTGAQAMQHESDTGAQAAAVTISRNGVAACGAKGNDLLLDPNLPSPSQLNTRNNADPSFELNTPPSSLMDFLNTQ